MSICVSHNGCKLHMRCVVEIRLSRTVAHLSSAVQDSTLGVAFIAKVHVGVPRLQSPNRRRAIMASRVWQRETNTTDN